MLKKAIFLILFVPVHLFLTAWLVNRYLFNYNPRVDTGVWVQMSRIIAFVLISPVALPAMMTGLVDEYKPMWVQILPFILNSLVWGVFVLAVWALIRRVFGTRRSLGKSDAAEPIRSA